MKFLFYIIILFFIIPLKASPIVSATWLSQNLCKENIKLIEVGLSYNSYLVEHIKCSQYTNFYKDGWRVDKKKVPMHLQEPEFLINVLNKIGKQYFFPRKTILKLKCKLTPYSKTTCTVK